jgi:NAD(P)-dependent dehydrogenase (short-subunit alcohol dehydrogenase family)
MASHIAIVAGGAGGLGQATVRALLSAGHTVVAIDRSEEALRALPAGVHRHVADATDPGTTKPAVDRIASEVGPPDILVNTIGAFELGDATTVTADHLRSLFDVNVGPALWLTQAVVPYMKERGSGAIVHVAARQGVEPLAGVAAYGATKAALVHLVRLLDVELLPHGIRVNAVLPQLIDTPKNRTFLPAEMLADAVEPAAIADVIAFLVSDTASPVSGALVPTYGGGEK